MNPTRPFALKKARNDGFTLIELLVVIVTVAILALLLLPAIAGTKPNSQAFQCLENLRQLTLGWQMYAGDNSGKITPDGDQQTQASTPTDPNILPGGKWIQWCPGNMATYSSYATNFIQAGLIYPYVKTSNVYKCPADQSGVRFGPYFYPRLRSYSMNCYMAPIDPWVSVGQQGTRDFFKDTDINNPKPSMTYVFIDENEHSINDSYFVSDPNQSNYWQDVPATRHGGAGSLSFADGHSEIKRWTDKNVLNPPRFGGFTGDPSSGDSAWLHQRATSVN
jgi:prepilin-type N-terminal cleavage/methylation domain-containing protein/prepilin-type processing-associated H-X9-DG protein